MGRTEGPDLNTDCERALVGYGTPFNESEMALFFECVPQCAQKVLDTADIVREAMFRQLTKGIVCRARHLLVRKAFS